MLFRSGTGELTVNGSRVYPLSAENGPHFVDGFRSLNLAPSFEIKAGEGGCKLKGLRARFYRI